MTLPIGTNGPGVPPGPEVLKARYTKRAISEQLEVYRAPPPASAKHYDVISVPVGPQVDYVAVTELHIVQVHFAHGRSWPHLKHGCICKGKPDAISTKLRGYVGIYDYQTGEYKILDLPERPLIKTPELQAGKSILRKTLRCKRMGSQKNSRVSVLVRESPSHWNSCKIPEIKPLDIMADHWSKPNRVQPPAAEQQPGKAVG